TTSKDLANVGKGLRQISLLMARGAVKAGSGTKQIFGKLSEGRKGQKSAAGYETAAKKPGQNSKKEKASLQKDSQLPKNSDDFELDESLIEDMNTFEPEVRPDAPQEKKEAEKDTLTSSKIDTENSEPRKIEYESEETGAMPRSEERRVGKEGRSRGAP